MIKTAERDNTAPKIAVSIDTLAGMLDCGKPTARQIGAAAGARVQIGKRVLYTVDKVNAYLNDLAERDSA